MPRRDAKRSARGSKQIREEKVPTLKTLVDKITRRNRHPESLVGPKRGKARVNW